MRNWRWPRTSAVKVKSVECNEISTLSLIQRDLCYSTDEIFLLLCNMGTDASWKLGKQMVLEVCNKQTKEKEQMGLTWIFDKSPSIVKITMGHRLPFFLMTNPVRPFYKKVSTLPIPIGAGHIRYQLQPFFPYREVVYPLRRDYMLRSITPKELVNC